MNNRIFTLLTLLGGGAVLPLMAQTSISTAPAVYAPASAVDSAYIFAYATQKNKAMNGLHFAWSRDRQHWTEIGPEYSFVQSDYGNWGVQKQMHRPSLQRQADGSWIVVWDVNNKETMVAYTTTPDLVHWIPQDYYPRHISDYFTQPKTTLTLPLAGEVEGEVHRVEWDVVQRLIDECNRSRYAEAQAAERIVNDGARWRDLQPVTSTLTIDAEHAKEISDKLIGIFFEDINYAADGGLYAELVQNRDFEYHPRDRKFQSPEWNATYAWTSVGEGLTWNIDSVQPLHPNNPHYARLTVTTPGGSLNNSGFDGIAVHSGDAYRLSLYARAEGGIKGSLSVALEDRQGRELARTTLKVPAGTEWRQLQAELKPTASCDSAQLVIRPLTAGAYALDMVSLFPKNTFRGRSNGLRADLAQALADLHPKFVRFPGGCVAHGDGLDNIYRWKNSIGPLEARVPERNIWKYHQTLGLGYYEYFQFCEDIGAEPLPVIAAAVPCQNSATGGYGQQGGIPMAEMEAYIQDICDLIEWANGDPKKSEWARKRAEAGHPKPFNLKYVGIGNEDLISQVFEKRFEMIFRALQERHPEITVVGTVGPSSEGSDYDEGWRFARRLGVPMVDEHYYRSPGWFLHHQDYYDRYARSGTKVYLGEYAAHISNRSNCLETALAEAMHLCNVERNGDVVAMTSYAPLLAKRGHTQWTPDMIYFTNTTVEPSTGYQVQAMFGRNSGNRYLPSQLLLNSADRDLQQRVVASVVQDDATGDWIVKVVNMLPVANEVRVDLSEQTYQANSKKGNTRSVSGETLTGALADRWLQPQVLQPTAVDEGGFTASLPAYSCTVFRVKW
jgi:alpha-L-arabinofuranosidase